ncbi:MAG: LysR family transcriptional regulator [Rhodospirillales bacterium]|jgi:DNA-binding transcriptional LysR family regulator|nr:LysR family transcriptional regulator [Rhodospirillales bacterium]
MEISLRQLRYFIAVAEHGSAIRAAEAINISQPSISTAIRDLEIILDQPLFHRRYAKGLSMTPFGRRKLVEARRIVSDASVFETTTEGETTLSGTVAFGYFTTLGPSHIPALLRHAENQLPFLNINMAECDMEDIQQRLRDGRMEIALTYDVGMTEQITREVLAEFVPYAVLPENHPLAKQKSVSLHDLSKEPFILIDSPMSREFLLFPFWQHGLEPNICHMVSSVDMVRGMVANGHGVSLLITRPTLERSHDGRALISLPLRESVTGQRLVAAWSGDHPLGQTAQAYLECMRSFFKVEKQRFSMPVKT